MKETLKLVLILTVFCLVAGFLLAWTNAATKAPIEAARRVEMMVALKSVLPPSDNDLLADAVLIEDGDRKWTFYVAREQGHFVGTAFRSESLKGYGGRIEILAGIQADGTLRGIEILEAHETPGLGTRVAEAVFRDQFKGKPVTDSTWARVTKDGGTIQAITGATISSRAVSEAVRNGLGVFTRHEAEIVGPGPVTEAGGTP